MMGHLIQAAGAVELMTCVKAIQTGWVPPTMNLNEQDPECDLDYVPNKARDMKQVWGGTGVDLCLSNSFGFGGQNDTVGGAALCRVSEGKPAPRSFSTRRVSTTAESCVRRSAW